MATQTGFVYGTGKALSANSFTAPAGGFSFYGWATSANTTTRTYTNQQSISTPSPAPSNGGTITLYAVWQRTLTFKSGLNQASSSTATQLRGGTSYQTVSFPAPAAVTGWTTSG